MKRKITMVLAGLGLCASMMMFNVQEVEGNPCVIHSRRLAPPNANACIDISGSCQAYVCMRPEY